MTEKDEQINLRLPNNTTHATTCYFQQLFKRNFMSTGHLSSDENQTVNH